VGVFVRGRELASALYDEVGAIDRFGVEIVSD
jgi:hypothetical protein